MQLERSLYPRGRGVVNARVSNRPKKSGLGETVPVRYDHVLVRTVVPVQLAAS